MVSPTDIEAGVPIPKHTPAQPGNQRRGSKILQSSLEIAFSYSRSQQRRYGNIQSAPSFVDASTRSWSSNEREDGEGEGEGEIWEDPEEDEGRRMSTTSEISISPNIFPSDPHPHSFDPRQDAPAPGEYVEDITPRPGFLSLFRPRTATLSSVPGDAPRSPSLASMKRLPHTTPSPVMGQGRDLDLDRRASTSTSTNTRPRSVVGQSIPAAVHLQDENTPLLGSGSRRKISISTGHDGEGQGYMGDGRRRSSITIKRRVSEVGESTNGQTLFNAIAVLVGIGLLSLPLAFAYAGWIGGTLLLFGFAWVTCHTAKLLARLILHDRTLLGYTDIGKRAFGGWASGAINVLFCLELFALSVALVVLFGDTLSVIYPSISSNSFKMIGFVIILPTTLLPLHLLSLPSLLSTLSSLLLIGVLLLDGFISSSIIHPAPTSWGPEWKHGNVLGGVGLVLAGFGGHAVIPGLARDMKDPKSFDRVITKAFIIATIISFIAGSAGYLMIGNGVSDEITRDLLQPQYHYPRLLNLFALWMIVINPVTKFGLCTRPLNVTIESLLSISPSLPGDESQIFTSSQQSTFSNQSIPPVSPTTSTKKKEREREMNEKEKLRIKEKKKLVLRVFSRISTTLICTITAILLPGFGKVMAFLGSFSAFLICIILPLLFHLRLSPSMFGDSQTQLDRVGHWIMVGISVILMIAGTGWAFIPGSGHGGLDDGR